MNKELVEIVDKDYVLMRRGLGMIMNNVLTDSEFANLIFISTLTGEVDCILRTNRGNGEIAGVNEIAEKINRSTSTVRKLLKKYIENDIIYKLDKKSEYNKYGKDLYIINPNLFRRDGELDDNLLEFFQDKRW